MPIISLDLYELMRIEKSEQAKIEIGEDGSKSISSTNFIGKGVKTPVYYHSNPLMPVSSSSLLSVK